MKVKRLLALFFILLLCLGLIGCGSPGAADTAPETAETVPETADTVTELEEGQGLRVHFIDVGQADAILIQGPEDQNIVIDAGNNGDGKAVVDYIRSQGVKELAAVIGTHPHEDHIGGLDLVIESFNVDKVYMLKVVHTTETFRDVLKAVSSKNLKVTTAAKGVKLPLASMEAVFLGPVGSDYENLNNHSAVLKLAYGETSFLFQGDAEAESEKEIINSDMGGRLKADVLKLGHHGSSTSTTPEYLDRVKPAYAVVMAGKGNDYGHPHKETMELLRSRNISVYRTDEQGTVIAVSDGKSISFSTMPGSYNHGSKNEAEQKEYTDPAGNGLIKGNINSKGEKIYHLPGGAYYDSTIPEVWFKTEKEAQEAGFRPSAR